MNAKTLCLMLIPAACLVGCAPTVETRTYSVYVTNRTAEPVTVFITKDGPPLFEQGWMSPEELAAGKISDSPINTGQVVGPHDTAGATDLKGQFRKGTNAVARFYRLTGKLEDFAAVSRGSPRRIDIALHPGMNAFEVTAGASGFAVAPAAPPFPAGPR